MNTNHIKSYAPKARSAFIAAMTKQAAKYGITAKGIEPLEQKGDLALIGDRAFPASIIRPRAALVQKVAQLGFAQAMEQASTKCQLTLLGRMMQAQCIAICQFSHLETVDQQAVREGMMVLVAGRHGNEGVELLGLCRPVGHKPLQARICDKSQ